VRLAKELLPAMVARGTGGVLFTASVASYELKDTGVTVTALMPGPTDTEFFERSGTVDTKVGQGPKDDPADVARDGFEALQSGKDHVVVGSRKNAAQTASGRLLTEKAKAATHAKMTKPTD
jgi:short-subunit dehydrogenase